MSPSPSDALLSLPRRGVSVARLGSGVKTGDIGSDVVAAAAFPAALPAGPFDGEEESAELPVSFRRGGVSTVTGTDLTTSAAFDPAATGW